MKKTKKKYYPTKEEKDLYQHEVNLKYKKLSVPKHAIPILKYNQGSQANFWEDLLMLWAKNRGYNASKVDVKGTWRADLNRYTHSKTTNGFPDIPMTIFGFSVMVEVKGKGDTQKPDQIAFQQRQEEAGGFYLIFDSLDKLSELEALADKLKSYREIIEQHENNQA